MFEKSRRAELVQRIPDCTVKWERGTTRQIPMTGVAIRKGQERAQAPGFTTMGTVRCDHCGQEFSISHPPEIADPQRAEKQAKWLELILAKEHQSNKSHADQLELPDC